MRWFLFGVVVFFTVRQAFIVISRVGTVYKNSWYQLKWYTQKLQDNVMGKIYSDVKNDKKWSFSNIKILYFES